MCKRSLWWLALWLLASSLVLPAQHVPRAEAFFGYSYMRIQIQGSTAVNSNGWNGELAGYFNRNVGVVADFSGHYPVSKGVDFSMYNFLFGPQVSYHGAATLSPFARFLIGGTHASAGFGGQRAADTNFAFGFGAGVDAKVAPAFALRLIQADYIRTHFLSHHQNQTRLSFGVVFRTGGR